MDLSSAVGMASLTAILGQVLQNGLAKAKAARDVEAERAIEERTKARRSRHEERAKAGLPST